MKPFIAIAAALLFSSCSTVGAFCRGASPGISGIAQQPDPIRCVSTVEGQQVVTRCR